MRYQQAAAALASQTPVKSTNVSVAHKRAWGFTTLASVTNPKASKATKVGYLNGILYLAPASSADGTFNLCPFAGACVNLCLGRESGQAAIRKAGEHDNYTTQVRGKRAIAFMREREAFMAEVARDIRRLLRIATQRGLRLCYRFNGSTDVGVPVRLLKAFPDVTFVDYTKNPNRMAAFLRGDYPPNYHVTFSRDTHNEPLCERFLAQGGNVAVVGDPDKLASAVLRAAPRVDGDAHDIRIPELDGRGRVVVLSPKGHKARNDESGFVVR